MIDNVNHPPHYTQHPSGVECITVVEHMSFNIGNAIKYLWRAGLKGAMLDDLKKADWYIQREIKRLTGKASTLAVMSDEDMARWMEAMRPKDIPIINRPDEEERHMQAVQEAYLRHLETLPRRASDGGGTGPPAATKEYPGDL